MQRDVRDRQDVCDRQLAQRLARDAPGALEELISLHEAGLRSLIGRLLAWDAETADVLRRLRRQRAEREDRLAMLLSVEREIETRAKLWEIRRRIAAISAETPVAEETAIVLLASADLKLRHYGQTKSAADDYRRVIELFPMSVWASSATKHLQTMMP